MFRDAQQAWEMWLGFDPVVLFDLGPLASEEE